MQSIAMENNDPIKSTEQSGLYLELFSMNGGFMTYTMKLLIFENERQSKTFVSNPDYYGQKLINREG